MISVSAKVNGTTARNLGKKNFRIRRIPDPLQRLIIRGMVQFQKLCY